MNAEQLRNRLLPKMKAALDFVAGQGRRIIETYPGYHPMYTTGGKWKREGELWTHWCEGFYPGIFWLLHKNTGDAYWRKHAEDYSRRLEPRRFDRNVHDLGFLFFSTYLRWYHLTDDASLREILIDAGRTLALRRQMGGYLASFIGPQSLFIDIMMNVGIILWAAKETEDETLRQIALEHCRTTERTIVRPDGGTAHEGIFDVPTGKFLREGTHQGYKPESTWTRGLAWSLYGFTAVHRLNRACRFAPAESNQSLLSTARRCADYFISHLPADAMPPWDFDAPTESQKQKDSSAAAIAASGLWDLSEELTGEDKERYQLAALRMLEALCSEEYLAKSRPEWEGLLLHGVYHIHKGLGVDESVAWGDHFFVEALTKVVAGKSEAAW